MPSAGSKRLLSLRCLHGPCNTYFVSTPIGVLRVSSCSHGLHAITQPDEDYQPDDSLAVALIRKEYDDNGYTLKPAVGCVFWLKAYFENPETLGHLPRPRLCPGICSPMGLFYEKVWLTLAEHVPFSATCSYSELAALSGQPRAALAVGTAMRRNPFHLLVPCHRVVKSDGTSGVYCGGHRDAIKQWLIRFELRHSQQPHSSTTVVSPRHAMAAQPTLVSTASVVMVGSGSGVSANRNVPVHPEVQEQLINHVSSNAASPQSTPATAAVAVAVPTPAAALVVTQMA